MSSYRIHLSLHQQYIFFIFFSISFTFSNYRYILWIRSSSLYPQNKTIDFYSNVFIVSVIKNFLNVKFKKFVCKIIVLQKHYLDHVRHQSAMPDFFENIKTKFTKFWLDQTIQNIINIFYMLLIGHNIR